MSAVFTLETIKFDFEPKLFNSGMNSKSFINAANIYDFNISLNEKPVSKRLFIFIKQILKSILST